MPNDNNVDYKQRVLLKITSSRFWFAVAAFLGSIGTGIAGLATDNEKLAIVGAVCSILSVAIYSACKTATGVAEANSDITQTIVSTSDAKTQTISAATDDKDTVATVLAPVPEQPVMEDE